MDALMNLNRSGIGLISPTTIKHTSATGAKRINSSGISTTTLIHRGVIAIIELAVFECALMLYHHWLVILGHLTWCSLFL